MDIPTDEDIAEELDNFDNYTDQAVIPGFIFVLLLLLLLLLVAEPLDDICPTNVSNDHNNSECFGLNTT